MKAITSILLFATLIIFTGCSKDGSSPMSADAGTGNMSLHFDKVNTPSNVAVITATLTRTGYSTISSNLNLLSDTSATISLSNIAAGSWHLLIQALDQSSTVTYKGETDVTIISGNITQVSLTLQQVQSGVGGIYIYVKWSSGTASNQWTDFPQNPILKTLYSNLDTYGVSLPFVLYDNGKYKMWFTNVDTYRTVGYAESSDGCTWSRTGAQPILAPGNTPVWDSGSVYSGPVIKINGMYYMYFSGSPDYSSLNNAQTGLAISQDGYIWTRKSAPVLTNSSGWEANVIATDVIKIGGIYYMYYTARQYPTYKIGLATSVDGITWVKYGTPILTATQNWEGTGVYNASIYQENGKYVMIYEGANNPNTGFGKATSTDGINWTKESTNPVFTVSNTANNWTSDIAYPCVRTIGTKTFLYYSGYNQSSGLFTLGVATKQN